MGWLTDDGRVMLAGGGQFLSVPQPQFVYSWASYHPPQGIALSWGEASKNADRLGVFDLQGKQRAVYSFPDFFIAGPWLDDHTLFANTGATAEQVGGAPAASPFIGLVPALVDLKAQTVHPLIHPFLDAVVPRGRNIIIAVQS